MCVSWVDKKLEFLNSGAAIALVGIVREKQGHTHVSSAQIPDPAAYLLRPKPATSTRWSGMQWCSEGGPAIVRGSRQERALLSSDEPSPCSCFRHQLPILPPATNIPRCSIRPGQHQSPITYMCLNLHILLGTQASVNMCTVSSLRIDMTGGGPFGGQQKANELYTKTPGHFMYHCKAPRIALMHIDSHTRLADSYRTIEQKVSQQQSTCSSRDGTRKRYT